MEKTGLKIILVIILVGIWGISSAQHKEKKFGRISKQDLAQKVCKIDTSAHAEILYERGKYSIDITKGNFRAYYVLHKIIKIYNKNAYHLADINLPYNERTESFTKIKACTYNLVNGKIVKSKVRNKSIIKEDVVDHYKVKKVAFPDIKEGSIIEIFYKKILPITYNLPTWHFQTDIPVRYSECKVYIPDMFTFKKEMKGYIDIKNNLSTSMMPGLSMALNKYIYYGENIPAFKDEDYVACSEDYISKIEFTLESYRDNYNVEHPISSDWKTICHKLRLNDNFGEVFKKRNCVIRLVNSLVNDSMDEDTKLNTIFAYVRDNIKWNERYSIRADKKFKKIIEKKTTSSGGVNLFLIALLKQAGFECNPVIISTMSNGRNVFNTPNLSKYNHTIACIQYQDKRFYLDAIDKYSSVNLLSYKDVGGGVLIKDNRFETFDIKNKTISNKYMKISSILDEHGVLEGKAVSQSNNHYASKFRSSFKDEDKRIVNLEKGVSDFTVEDYTLSSIKDNSKAIKEEYSFIWGEDNEDLGTIYLPALLHYSKLKNPFTSQERILPVDFSFRTFDKYMIHIVIPENYTVEQIPKSINVILPDKSTRFVYSCKAGKGIISISSSLKILRNTYFKDEYLPLSNLFDIMVKKYSEYIVLKRK